jgi:hypothetical protein
MSRWPVIRGGEVPFFSVDNVANPKDRWTGRLRPPSFNQRIDKGFALDE